MSDYANQANSCSCQEADPETDLFIRSSDEAETKLWRKEVGENALNKLLDCGKSMPSK